MLFEAIATEGIEIVEEVAIRGRLISGMTLTSMTLNQFMQINIRHKKSSMEEEEIIGKINIKRTQ